MKHPRTRAQRRHNGEIWRDRQRFIMLNVWFPRTGDPGFHHDNRMWWARKQSSAHGNRCICHYEKYDRKSIRKRRRLLDAEIVLNLLSFDMRP